MQMQESPEVLLTAKENCYLHVEILALATHRQTVSIQLILTLQLDTVLVCHFVPCGPVRRQGSPTLSVTATPAGNGSQPDRSTTLSRAHTGTAFPRSSNKRTSLQPSDAGWRRY